MGVYFGLSILFCWPMCLFLCQFHTVLITTLLQLCNIVWIKDTWCLQVLVFFKEFSLALTGGSVGCASSHKVMGCCFDSQSPRHGTCLGCRPGPQLAHVGEAADQCFPHTSVFLFLSFSLPPLSLKTNKIFFFKEFSLGIERKFPSDSNV